MRTSILTILVAMSLLAVPVAASAQEISPEEQQQLETLNQSTPEVEAPADDVMRPTKHGIRLTPALARAVSRAWIGEMVENDMGGMLSEDQKAKLSETMARRMMEMGHKYGKQVGPFLELTIEQIGPGGFEVKPDKVKEFGRQAKETVPVWREFFGHMAEDFGPYLDERQKASLKEKQELIEKGIDRFEKRMDRWSNGDRKEKEEPFDDLDNLEEEKAKEGSEDGKSKKAPEMKSAERRAAWAMRRIDPMSWREFLSNVRNTFKLTDEQYAQGQAVLEKYTAKAREIMTPEWREKVRRNQIMQNMQDAWRKESPAPWLYHLTREYNELVKPLTEMEKAFRIEVLNLVTRDQREAVIRDLREFAAKHGMTDAEMDIRFPTTGPA
jgi:hypothetical protein